MLNEKLTTDFERLGEQQCIVVPAQAEVRKVIQKPSKDGVAVLAVLRSVQDVGMPNLVDFLCWNDRTIWVNSVQHKKLAVALNGGVHVGWMPTVSNFWERKFVGCRL